MVASSFKVITLLFQVIM